jgi:Asparagine synthase
MFFTAYLGNDEGLSRWQGAICAHAEWLHAGAHLERRRLRDRRNLALGWVGRAPATASTRWTESGEYIVVTTSSAVQLDESVSEGTDGWVDGNQHLPGNDVRISARLHSGEIRIVVPPTTPEQFYYAREACGYAFSNDMRLLLRMTGIELDLCGVCGLFQYGAIPPTMTVSKTVKRIQNGYMLHLRSCTDEPVFTPLRQQRCLEEQDNGSDNPVARVQAVLDSILSRVPEAAVLYFSGGVDSSLLASRMVQLGRTDIRLVNYSFGSTDQEGILATQIACWLGLEYHRVVHEPSKDRACSGPYRQGLFISLRRCFHHSDEHPGTRFATIGTIIVRRH